MKVYGPYTRKDGRKHVILIDREGLRRTVSYPRYLMEQKLGRTLDDDETIDHIDGDITNDDPSNLRIVSRKENASIGVKKLIAQDFICPMCNTQFELSGKELSWALSRAKQGRAGPFCSRGCSGTYGRLKQTNKINKLTSNVEQPEYYKEQTLDKV